MTDTTTTPRVGDRVLVTEGKYLTGLPVEGILVKADDPLTFAGVPHPYAVDIPKDSEAARKNGNCPRIYASKVEALTPARPTIDFSDAERDRSKARQYASDLQSRVNLPRTNEVLQQIASGEKVDAYEILAVLPDVFSGCATRGAHSTMRRTHTKMARHLAYIANAVVTNHAEGLPTMEPGARSPKIAELTREIGHATTVNQSLTADLTAVRDQLREARQERATLTQAASDERRRLCAEIDALKDEVKQAHGLADMLQAERDASRVEADALAEDLTRHVALREYVEEHLLDDEGRAAAAGFTHGWTSATRL